MSLVGDRTTIANALTTVEGVKGYAYRPKATKPGDGWPLLSSLDRAAGRSFTVTWRILIVLPGGEVAASEWIDAHHEQLVDGLLDVGFVDTIAPVKFDTGAGDLHGLQITMRSE
ncbi:hypothetical protein ABZ807_09460 [Micromonospora sp. NPDC047548]|uniref:hypothetical protein n=1 Tax=Micromonospora sp. NPDC047548 TaxID=3155624 RepID=UPI0033C14670